MGDGQRSPPCPLAGCVDGYLVGYEYDQETSTHTGQLRCAVCNRHVNASPEQIALADAADAHWTAQQVGEVAPVLDQPTARDPDDLHADEPTVMFGRRLRFQALLRRMVDDGRGHVIDLSGRDAEVEAPGTVAVLQHARELRLGGQRPGP